MESGQKPAPPTARYTQVRWNAGNLEIITRPNMQAGIDAGVAARQKLRERLTAEAAKHVAPELRAKAEAMRVRLEAAFKAAADAQAVRDARLDELSMQKAAVEQTLPEDIGEQLHAIAQAERKVREQADKTALPLPALQVAYNALADELATAEKHARAKAKETLQLSVHADLERAKAGIISPRLADELEALMVQHTAIFSDHFV